MMHEKPARATVIIPSYNHSRFIADCVISACSQDYPSKKVVVIDDGSTDDTKRILTELSKSYDFEHHYLQHQGLIGVLNWSIKNIALGDYVMFLGSDDTLPLNRLSLQVPLMDQQLDVYLAYGNYTEVDEFGKKLTYIKCLHPLKNCFSELLLSNFIAAPTTLIRTSIFDELGGFDTNLLIEDWALWLKIAQKHKIAHIDQNLAFYRTHPHNQHKKIDFIHSETLKLLGKYASEKNYPIAVSLAHLKYIIKSFLQSYGKGFDALRKYFEPKSILHILFCFALGKGPFRKFRLSYALDKYIFSKLKL